MSISTDFHDFLMDVFQPTRSPLDQRTEEELLKEVESWKRERKRGIKPYTPDQAKQLRKEGHY